MQEMLIQMSEEISIGKWKIPKELFDEYVKFRIFADGYVLKKIDTLSGTDYERAMRWRMCVKKVMEIHEEICAKLGIAYSTDLDNEFYKLFFRKVQEQIKLKG